MDYVISELMLKNIYFFSLLSLSNDTFIYVDIRGKIFANVYIFAKTVLLKVLVNDVCVNRYKELKN